MTTKVHLCIISLLTIILYACGTDDNNILSAGDVVYVGNNIKENNLQNSSQFHVDVVGVRDIFVDDSVLFLSTSNPDGFICGVDKHSGKLSGSFLQKGKGPLEILSPVFFSSVSFRKDSDGLKGLLLSENKVMEVNMTASLSSGNTVGVPVGKVSKGKFVTTIFPIKDSTVVMREADEHLTRQDRCVVTGKERTITGNQELLNEQHISKLNDPYLFNIVSSSFGYNPSNGLCVEAYGMLNIIHMYSLYGDFMRTICFGKPIDKIEDIENLSLEKLPVTSKCLRTYDNCFAVLYKGITMLEDETDKTICPSLYVFSWEGRPIAKWVLSKPADTFDIDFKDKVLYTLNWNEETIWTYNLDNLI